MTKNIVAGSYEWNSGGTGTGGTYNSDERPDGIPSGEGITGLTGIVGDRLDVDLDGLFPVKTNAKPWIVWSADDDGVGNPSALGRKTSWVNVFQSTTAVTTVVTAPNSSQAVRADYVNEGAGVMPEMDFSSAPDSWYLWRRVHQAFDVETDYGLRLNVGVTSSFAVGETVTGATSTATSDITFIKSPFIWLDSSTGNVGSPTFTDFINGEVITGDIVGSSTVVGTLFKTANVKAIRSWEIIESPRKNWYITFGPASSGSPADVTGRIFIENSSESAFPASNWDNVMDQLPNEWVIQEVAFQAGTVDNFDTIIDIWQNRSHGWLEATRKFKAFTSTNSQPFTRVSQTQVSNGMQPGSFEYSDMLYIDDTLHRVVIGDASTYDACTAFEIQIPKTWITSDITIQMRLGAFASFVGKFIYIVGPDGLPITQTGFAVP